MENRGNLGCSGDLIFGSGYVDCTDLVRADLALELVFTLLYPIQEYKLVPKSSATFSHLKCYDPGRVVTANPTFDFFP
jgi:hypothetical protein